MHRMLGMAFGRLGNLDVERAKKIVLRLYENSSQERRSVRCTLTATQT